jgi:hypothetical protein
MTRRENKGDRWNRMKLRVTVETEDNIEHWGRSARRRLKEDGGKIVMKDDPNRKQGGWMEQDGIEGDGGDRR